MATPQPPVCTIDEAGIHQPTFAECRAYYVDGYRGLYGQDLYLGSDTQDGQWIDLQATALHAANSGMVAVYNAFAPSTAQGAGLSRSVKINGLTRAVATDSTADVTIIGQAGSVITGGSVTGENASTWALPATVVIPDSGAIVVTATCTTLGAVTARPGTLTGIATPTQGWQSVTNEEAATPGAPVERDAALRLRQSVSTSLPANAILGGIVAAVAAIPGVARVKPYENASRDTDANGLPPRSFALVVDGGNADTIATAIGLKKAPGGTSYGTSSGTYTDAAGIAHAIPFFRPHGVPITYRVTLRKRAGYTADTADRIRAALATWTLAREIGGTVLRAEASVPAQLFGNPIASTFQLLSVDIARDGATPGPADIALAFDEAATCEPANIDVVLAP